MCHPLWNMQSYKSITRFLIQINTEISVVCDHLCNSSKAVTAFSTISGAALHVWKWALCMLGVPWNAG